MKYTAEQLLGFWFSSPNVVAAEIAHAQGFRNALLDIEHGSFDLSTLDRFIPYLKQAGFYVMAKVLTPDRGPIQQALDFGANAVVIPHVDSAAHAELLSSYAKFPDPTAPGLRDRSYAGGRPVDYQGPKPGFFTKANDETKVLPMIESAGALAEIEGIFALPTVDGVFVGPSDLALSRGRGSYRRDDADWKDLEKIANAAKKAGKPWYIPAWAPIEREVAMKLGVTAIISTMEYGALFAGVESAKNMLLKEIGQ